MFTKEVCPTLDEGLDNKSEQVCITHSYKMNTDTSYFAHRVRPHILQLLLLVLLEEQWLLLLSLVSKRRNFRH